MQFIYWHTVMCCINKCYFKSFLLKLFLCAGHSTHFTSGLLLCFCFVIVEMLLICPGEDIWRYVGKLMDAQKSMLDDRFKWKVSLCFSYICFLFFLFNIICCQVREMEKRREGRPGEARATLRCFWRENGYVSAILWMWGFTSQLLGAFFLFVCYHD